MRSVLKKTCILVIFPAMVLVFPAAARPPCITVESTSAAVVLGKEKKVKLTVRVGGSRQTPRLRASVGRLGKPKRIRPGTFMVTYTPPYKREPDVALISARVSDPKCPPGFMALALLTERKVRAKVAPNARVTLKIGKTRYGPARADSRGNVEISAKLLPGHPQGTLEIALPGGKQQQRKIKLKSKRYTRLGLVSVPAAVRADGISSARLYLFAADPFGRAIRNPRFKLHARAGRISPVTPAGGGVGMATFKPRRSLTGGHARIEAQLLGPRRGKRTFKLRLVPGSAISIALLSSVETLTANGESRATITVDIKDDQGQGQENLPVAIVASSGQTGAVKELGGGRYQTELIAPLGGEGRMEVKAAVGNQEQKLAIQLRAPPPLSITADPPSVVADGKSEARIEIRAFGPQGAPGAAEVLLTASHGGVPGSVSLSGTRAEAVFRAPEKTGTARVEVRLGVARAFVEIPLTAGPPHTLKLESVIDTVLTDGEKKLTFVVLVKDKNYNPVKDTRVLLTASVGAVEPPRLAGTYFQSTYIPPRGASGTAVIRAAATGGVSGELTVGLRAPPQAFGLSLAAGMEHNLQRIGAPLISVEGSYRLTGPLFLLCGAGWFGNRIEAACPEGPSGCGDGLEVSVNAVPLSLGLSYRLENGSRGGLVAGNHQHRLSVRHDRDCLRPGRLRPRRHRAAARPGGNPAGVGLHARPLARQRSNHRNPGRPVGTPGVPVCVIADRHLFKEY
jgi:hypothetical protein